MEKLIDYSNIEFKNNGKLKLLIIVGTRPEIIRLAEVIKKCRKYFDCILAHTGQNYDYNLNGIFFRDLKLVDPEVYMNAVGDDLGATIGNIIDCSYKLMVQIQPDALLILGDTNSCLSAIPARRMLPRGNKPQDSRYNFGRKYGLFRACPQIFSGMRTSERKDVRYGFAYGGSVACQSGTNRKVRYFETIAITA